MKQTWKNSEDQNGFSFWPLSQLAPVVGSRDGQWFEFADYLQSSWTYGCDFGPESAGAVVLIGRSRPDRITDSFEEFVDLYLANGERLYRGSGVI